MSIETELETIQTGVAIAPLTDRAFLRITGSDATRWLNGMVTNSIKDLAPGEGNYNFLLNAQGRIQADCTIYRDGDSFLLATDNSQLETVHQLLDKFIIMDDVELEPLSGLEGVLVGGPQALNLVMNLGTANAQAAPCSPDAQPSQGQTLKQTCYAEVPVTLLKTLDGFEIWSDATTVAAIRQELSDTNAVTVSPEALEAHRILSGTPKFGVDIRDKDLPQETNQTQALHFNKGCYLGQEIVERIRSRGQVHRTFTKFTLAGDLPTAFPTPLEATALSGAPAKPAGEITSAIRIGDTIHALGYIRREALELKQTVTYSGGIAIPETR